MLYCSVCVSSEHEDEHVLLVHHTPFLLGLQVVTRVQGCRAPLRAFPVGSQCVVPYKVADILPHHILGCSLHYLYILSLQLPMRVPLVFVRCASRHLSAFLRATIARLGQRHGTAN